MRRLALKCATKRVRAAPGATRNPFRGGEEVRAQARPSGDLPGGRGIGAADLRGEAVGGPADPAPGVVLAALGQASDGCNGLRQLRAVVDDLGHGLDLARQGQRGDLPGPDGRIVAGFP